MANIIIVGAQWGDEGKGKIVDYLTEHTDVVVRAQGGNNAGHTVISNGTKYVLHLIPSGVLWPGKQCVIGNGVVLDPVSLLEEIDGLHKQGIAVTPENLRISESAHLVLLYHRGLDAARETALGEHKIGTTKRGIGPSYADKINRTGLRAGLLRKPELLTEVLARKVAEANLILTAAGLEPVDFESIKNEVLEAGAKLTPYLDNTAVYLHEQMKAGKSLLFEGAQGTYLDIDHGTYPFVTSSNTTAGGACTGAGVPPKAIDRVVGVAKAYTTRVGSGPFVTEDDELSDLLHNMGREFGATTGRARRCGWLDFVLLRFANLINGFGDLAFTNLDGLDGLSSIKVCVAYDLDGERIEYPPAAIEDLARCKPIYETLPGWLTDISGVTNPADLPANARGYLDRISKELGVPISHVGVGPAREQTLDMR